MKLSFNVESIDKIEHNHGLVHLKITLPDEQFSIILVQLSNQYGIEVIKEHCEAYEEARRELMRSRRTHEQDG